MYVDIYIYVDHCVESLRGTVNWIVCIQFLRINMRKVIVIFACELELCSLLSLNVCHVKLVTFYKEHH